jgi:Ecdysteroid kinase-like family
MARCSLPVLDLLYFFYTSTTQKLRRDHMLNLLEYYMSEVRSAFAARGVVDPGKFFYTSLNEMHQEMKQKKSFGFVMACIVIPAVVADISEMPGDMDQMAEDIFKNMEASPFAKMYSGPLFCSRIKELVEDFDDMGFFIELSK